MKILHEIIRCWLWVTFPVRWFVSNLVLSVVYFTVITPIGLALRMMGYDPMRRRRNESQESYWILCAEQEDVESYFRQS